MYSIKYPESVFEEYAGGLALKTAYRGLMNFAWFTIGTTQKVMKRKAQDAANAIGKPIMLVIHSNKSMKLFDPEETDA